MHATSAASEHNWSVCGQIDTKYRNKLSLDNKIIFIRGTSNILAEPDEQGHEEYSLHLYHIPYCHAHSVIWCGDSNPQRPTSALAAPDESQ
eukprot:256516-Chlamydomonas_euryale.AAC.1